MAYLLEIVGSTIIGGFIILIIFNLNSTIIESSSNQKFDKIAQENLTSLVEEIEYDLRKIGYRAPDPAILVADSNLISFRYDVDNNGSPDIVNYFMSDTSALSQTPNPRDVFLYRTVNGGGGQLVTSNLGVTNFRLWYYDGTGNLTTNANDVRTIKYALSIESVFPYDGEYESAYIVRLVQPNNLR